MNRAKKKEDIHLLENQTDKKETTKKTEEKEEKKVEDTYKWVGGGCTCWQTTR